MGYGRLTLEVIFSYEDNVPMTVAASRIVKDAARGDVITVSGGNLELITEREVYQAVTGGCGDCSGCQEVINDMIVPGYVDTAPSDSEDAAIKRAQGA